MAERKGLLEWAIRGLKHELSVLEAELAGSARGVAKAIAAGAEAAISGKRRRPKRQVSAASRARMAAAQKARWAKLKTATVSKKAAKKTRKVSAAAKRAASERMKAFWAKRKAS